MAETVKLKFLQGGMLITTEEVERPRADLADQPGVTVTANEHYKRAMTLFTQYEESLASHQGQVYQASEVVAVQAGLARILKAAEVQMMMANYKAGT
jgi:hypothetical protein